jgi:hypothetical protein
VLDEVFGSLVIGLKKIISVFRESGDEQSLGVSDVVDEPLFCSEPSGFEILEDVDGEFDPELFVIFEKNVMLRLRADLNILLYLLAPGPSLELTEDVVSLQITRNKDIAGLQIQQLSLIPRFLLWELQAFRRQIAVVEDWIGDNHGCVSALQIFFSKSISKFEKNNDSKQKLSPCFSSTYYMR